MLMAINVFEDITEHKQSELRARFLADAATVLASSLDYETTLQQVAELAIPTVRRRLHRRAGRRGRPSRYRSRWRTATARRSR